MRSLDQLDIDFRNKLTELMARCAEAGADMRVTETLRHPYRQARLWRQSRTRAQVDAAIGDLEAQGAVYLAGVMRAVGPQPWGPHVTNALPGVSWHNIGYAADFYWNVGGRAVWSLTDILNGVNGYEVLGREALALGLTSGLYWRHKDAPHVQYYPESSPIGLYTWKELDERVKDLWDGVSE